MTTPLGICQVCHTATQFWKKDRINDLPHNEDIDCDSCHDILTGGRGNGHDDNHFAWDGNCGNCHFSGSEPVVSVVHGNYCGACHDTLAGTDATTEKVGDPANGIDGDATAANGTAAGDNWTSVFCSTCHVVNTPAVIHHDSKTGYAGAGNCTFCHNGVGVGGHAGDHQTLVVNVPLCATACHIGTAPVDADNVPVDGTSGNKVHDACIDCHDTSSPIMALNAPTTIAPVMPDGGLGSDNGGGTCVDCHTNGFAGHDHGSAGGSAAHGLSSVTLCEDCHIPYELGSAVSVDIHDADNCFTCHNSSTGALQDSAFGAADTASCTDCHAGYFDGHDHVHDVTYTPAVDTSQSDSQPCANCHLPLNTSWTGIVDEHNVATNGAGACSTCHNSGRTTDISSGFTSVNNVILTAGAGVVTCDTCHEDKTPNGDHGGHPLDFSTTANCSPCHTAAGGVLKGIHGDGTTATCTFCHSDSPTRDNEMLGGNGDGDARLANGIAEADPGDGSVWAAVNCEQCHNQTQVPGFHGIAIGEVTSSHQLSSDITLQAGAGIDCEACHSTNVANEQLSTHMPADTVANCVTICHANTTASNTSGIVAKDVIDNVTFSDPAPNQDDSKCEDCHAAKGDYQLHGLSDDDSVADGIDDGTGGLVSHNNLGGSRGAWADSGGTIPSTRAAGYAGKIDIAKALIDDDYNCADCHAADHTNLTSLEAMRVHTFMQGSGNGNCLTCHSTLIVADEINTGKGMAGITIECEDCHSITNGNGPSGEKMYQYDGIRHHKTAHAQAGNCTRCHADPRPADLSAEPGFAGTAAVNDGSDADGIAWNDGFDDDFDINNPNPRPTQMACRLCHTNYETYTVDVKAEIDADWDTTELPDLHGYNKNPPAHGLTIYADDYDARGTVLTYEDFTNLDEIQGASQTTQVSIPSHRIDAVDSSSRIDVYNYGACFSCHTVQIRHAAPKPDTDYDTPLYVAGPEPIVPPAVPQDIVDYWAARNTHPYDTLRYAPGRSVFNDFRGGSGDFWNDHTKGMGWLSFNDNCCRGLGVFWNATYYFDNVNDYSPNSLVDVPVNTNVNQLEDLPGLTLPTTSYPIRNFDPVTAPVVDGIAITVAKWTGTGVYVEATSTLGPAQSFSFSYTGAGGPCNTVMNWDIDHYEGTCSDASGWTATDTVTVSNTTTSAMDDRTRVVIDGTGTIAENDSYSVPAGFTTQLLVMSNDQGLNNAVVSTDDTNLNANCSTAVAGGGVRIDITCGATTGAMGTFDYFVQGDVSSDTATVSIDTYFDNASDLDWTGETGYTTDGVDPDTAVEYYNLTFRVKYTDIEDSAPSPAPQLWIDLNNDNDYTGEEATELFSMSEADGGDTVYSDGKLYTLDQTIGAAGTYRYGFVATDGIQPATGNAAYPNFNNITIDGAITACASGCDFTTLQAAIDDPGVLDGDYLRAADASYAENINFNGKNITVYAQVPGATSIIGGTMTNTAVVTFNSGETSSAVLEGFIIDNQFRNSDDRGISIINSSPTIKNTSVTGNTPVGATSGGAGIYIDNGSPVIDTCQITQNTAVGQSGGGVYITGAAGGVIITNSDVSFNEATTTGGIYLSNVGIQTTVTGSTIRSNNSTGGDGGAFYVNNSSLLINTSQIITNTALASGGGIYIAGAAADVSITDSTIGGSAANKNTSATAGAIYFSGPSTGSLSITNSDISYNEATNTGGIYLDNVSTETTVAGSTINYNNSTGNDGGAFYLFNSLLRIANSSVDNNQVAAGSGGGAMNVLGTGSTVVIENNSTLNNNGPARFGGAIYMRQSTAAAPLSISDSTLDNNSSAMDGGAIYINGMTNNSIFTNVTFSNNTAGGTSRGGGGIGDFNSPFIMTNSLFSNNSVTASGNYCGGGFYLSGPGAIAQITDTTFQGNSAPGGGALCLSSSTGGPTLNLYSVKLMGNSATGSRGGGGILLDLGSGGTGNYRQRQLC